MLQLLRACSGAFQPGVLTALVGSSGAGKTTLMDVIAGRKTSARPRTLCYLSRLPALRVFAFRALMRSQARPRPWTSLPVGTLVRLLRLSVPCKV